MKFRWPWKRAEQRAVNLTGGQWNDLDWGHKSSAGVSVSAESAMRSAAVVACIKTIAEAIAQTPIHLLERDPDGGRKRATDHPVYGLVHDAPNSMVSPFAFKEAAALDLLTRGNTYHWIERDDDDRPAALWRLPCEAVSPEVTPSGIVYEVTVSGGGRSRLRAHEILHVPALGDGVIGLDPLSYAREAIGHDLALSEYGARFFSNSSVPPFVISVPGSLDEDTQREMRKAIEEQHGGLFNAHKVGILGSGAEIRTVAVSPENAQWCTARGFALADICRIFRVSPLLVGETARSSFANAREMGAQFLRYSLQPWLTRLEQSFDRALLAPHERGRFYHSFDANAFVRSALPERFEAYAKARQHGWLSVNEIRAKEDLPGIGPAGDVYLEPENLRPAGSYEGRD